MTIREDAQIAPYWLDSSEVGGPAKLGLAESYLEGIEDAFVSLELLWPAGTRIRRGETFGFIHTATESIDLRSPVNGLITSTNLNVLNEPRLVQQSPYHNGWLLEIELMQQQDA